MKFIYLLIAILAETFATTYLKKSNGFTVIIPTAFTIIGYAVAFYFLSLTLRELPIGIAYALWSGIGIILITIIGIFAFKQIPDLATVIGIALIIAGVIVINLFSKMNIH